MKTKLIVIIVVIGLYLMTGCSKKEEKVMIAEQYGLAYAPIEIAKSLGFFEEFLPEQVVVEYVKLANTAAIREAMLAGHLDIGFMGIPPFLIGSDKGMDWKIIMGISKSPLGLVVEDENIKTLDDLIGKGKIALPQPGSIQHILLAMRASELYGKADMFDAQLISMKHPDGYQALLNDPNVVGHFTSPPYLFQELDEIDTHLLLDGDEAMGGPFTFIVGVCRKDFSQDKIKYEGIENGLLKAIIYINEYPEETIKILAKAYNLEEIVVKDYIYNRGMIYNSSVIGVQKFINFMYEEEYLENRMKAEELEW